MDLIKFDIKDIIEGKIKVESIVIKNVDKNKVKKNMEVVNMENVLVEKIDLLINGEILDIEEVLDFVFLSKLMGDGFVIKFSDGLIYLLVDGIIGVIFLIKYVIIIKF